MKFEVPKSLARIVLREELFVITGDCKCALLLDYLIQWTENSNATDKILDDMQKRSCDADHIEKINGWISKPLEDIAKETMLGVSAKDIEMYLSFMVDKDWLEIRKNTRSKLGDSYQYKLILNNLKQELERSGFPYGCVLHNMW